MNQPTDPHVCPLCGHAGRKETTERQMAFPGFNLDQATLKLFKCPECRTIFTEAAAVDPFSVLVAAC